MLGQHRHSVLVAFAVAHHDLIVGKVDVFHPQANALHQSQARAVQEGGHDPCGACQVPQHRSDLVLRQHHRDAVQLLGTHHFVNPANVLLENLLV